MMTAIRLHDSTGGFAQISALLALAGIAGVLAVTLSQSVEISRQTVVLDRIIRGSVIADSGVRRLLAAIDDPDDRLEDEVGILGFPRTIEVSGVQVGLAIEGEAGKLNPLTIPWEVLERYVDRAGITAADRTDLLERLQDARRTVDMDAALRSLHVFLIPLLSLDELERDFSVRTNLAGVDPHLASERILAALPDLGEAAATELVRSRHDPSAIGRFDSRYFATGHPLFTLVTTVHWNDVDRFTRRVPIEITTAGKVLVLDGFR